MKYFALFLLPLFLLSLCACVSDHEMIQRRIRERQATFDTFPAETQERISNGIVLIGDTKDMVWMAFGPPSRLFSRITEGGTNVVWSYSSYQTTYTTVPESSLIFYSPSRVDRRFPATGTRWVEIPETTVFERRRVEFQEDKVFAIELLKDNP